MVNNEAKDNSVESYLDLIDVFNFLNRGKKYILFFALISGIFGSLYSLSLKRVWEGQFQIVVEDIQNDFGSSKLFNIIDGEKNKSEIATQIAILGSPSVLMPIYSYYRGFKDSEEIGYKDWQRNLYIDQRPKTSILTIRYQDQNKQNILPILNEISKTYRLYSDKKEKKDLTKKYENIIKQVDFYTKKRDASLGELTSYAYENDIGISSDNNEEIRIQSITNMKNINEQIERISSLKNKKGEELLYKLNSLEILAGSGLLEEAQQTNKSLLIRKQFFKDNDIKNTLLEERRNFLIKELYKFAIEKLMNEKAKMQAQIDSSLRPKEVLIEFNRLQANSQLNNSILNDLEKLKNITFLEKNDLTKPLEEITVPTLLDNPVAPERKKIVFFYVLIGSLIGIAYSKFKELKSDILYSETKLKEILKEKNLFRIEKSELHWKKHIFLRLENVKSKLTKDKLNIIKIKDVNSEFIDELKNSADKLKINTLFTESIEDNAENVLLICELGLTKIKNLKSIYKLAKLYKDKNLFYFYIY